MAKPNLLSGVAPSLLVALPCSVISCLVTLWLVNPSSQDPNPPRPEVDIDLLVQRLDDLRQRIDVGFRAAEDLRTAPAVERHPVQEGDPLAEEVSGIIDRLDQLQAIVKSSIAGSQVPLQRSVPINMSELEALDLLNQTDPANAQRSTMLLTLAEVIARFGFPSSSSSNEVGLFFKYVGTDSQGVSRSASFLFKDGFVTRYHPPRR